MVELGATFRITECSDNTGPVDVHLQYRPTREHHVSVCVSVLNKNLKGTMYRHEKRGQVGRWVDLAKVSVGPVMEADGDRVQTSEAEDTRPNTSRPDVK